MRTRSHSTNSNIIKTTSKSKKSTYIKKNPEILENFSEESRLSSCSSSQTKCTIPLSNPSSSSSSQTKSNSLFFNIKSINLNFIDKTSESSKNFSKESESPSSNMSSKINNEENQPQTFKNIRSKTTLRSLNYIFKDKNTIVVQKSLCKKLSTFINNENEELTYFCCLWKRKKNNGRCFGCLFSGMIKSFTILKLNEDQQYENFKVLSEHSESCPTLIQKLRVMRVHRKMIIKRFSTKMKNILINVKLATIKK